MVPEMFHQIQRSPLEWSNAAEEPRRNYFGLEYP